MQLIGYTKLGPRLDPWAQVCIWVPVFTCVPGLECVPGLANNPIAMPRVTRDLVQSKDQFLFKEELLREDPTVPMEEYLFSPTEMLAR